MHGHTKIELTDQRTGRTQVVEQHNRVTGAVAQLINGFGGMASTQYLASGGEYGTSNVWELLESLYGGLLLYDKALGSDPDTLFAPADAALVGTAAAYSVNTGSSPLRGSYNRTESSIDLNNGVATFVYDFGTNQGNGVIASVALTHRYGGFMGELPASYGGRDGSVSDAYISAPAFGALGQYSLFPGASGCFDYSFIGRMLLVDAAADEALFGRLTNDQLALRWVDAHLKTVDLFCPAGSSRAKRSQTLDLTGLPLAASRPELYRALGYDPDADKLYVVCTPGTEVGPSDKLRVRTFDRADLKAVTYEIKNPTGQTLNGMIGGSFPALCVGGKILGGCLVMQGKSGGLYKIPLADPTKTVAIETGGLTMTYVNDMHDGKLYFYGYNLASYGAVLNLAKNRLYAMEAYSTQADRLPAMVPVVGEPVNVLRLNYPRYTSDSDPAVYDRCVRRNYLATVNDLAKPVEKTADKTMKITYTLRKEEG